MIIAMKSINTFNLSDFVRRYGAPPNTILMNQNDFERLKNSYVVSVSVQQGEDVKDAKYCAVGSLKYMDMDIKVSDQVEEGKLFFALIEEAEPKYFFFTR